MVGCQCQLLGVKWQDHIRNTDIADMTGLLNIADIISKRCHMLFGDTIRLDWMQHIKHWNKLLQQKLVIVWARTGEDPLDIPKRHGCSRSARELRPAGDKCGRAQRNMDIVESRRNGLQLSTCRVDDDDDHDLPSWFYLSGASSPR